MASTEGGVVLRGRRRLFQNTRFDVYADHIESGTLEVQDYLVVAPHCHRSDLLTGVAVVPVRGDEILLLQRYRHGISQHVWELPRGFIDDSEEPSVAALRELAEETGLACPPEQLLDLGTFFPDAGIIRGRVALFAATACQAGAERLEDEIGLDGAVWRSRREVRDLLRRNELQEGASCVALHRYFAGIGGG
jgi:ADP-ribose pyrophosphatase